MKKRIRKIVIICGVLIGVFLVLNGARMFIMRKSHPKTDGTIKVEGLSAPVEIYRDEYGVPHIYADNMDDLFFAQGFVHAQDRFWQMEFWRRVGAGRLSELFGEDLLGVDVYLRTVGFKSVAEQEYSMLEEATRRYLEAYSAGVNAYILHRKPTDLGLEFTFLKLKGVELEIEPWTPVNALTWFKLMAEDLSSNLQRELNTLDLIRAVGLEMTADFYPEYREEEMPFVFNDEEISTGEKRQKSSGLNDLTDEEISLLTGINTRMVGNHDPSRSLALGKGTGIGSNAWVVSGRLTDTGLPILANDSHLGIQMPSIWYEVGLHSKKGGGEGGNRPFRVRGFSFAGVPGIIIGHNDRIAWGLTNMGPDVQDLYIERVNPNNPNQYEVNGEWLDMEVRKEEIIVNGREEPYVLLVRSTRHGPVITDQGEMVSRNSFSIIPGKSFPSNLVLTALSLRWTALEPNKTMDIVFLLNRAQNFEDFHQALRYFAVPSQNVLYADVDGNIGYQAPGLIPIRAQGDGLLPVPGWTDEYEWTGYIPYEDLPRVFNPAKGYIVTANNPVVSDFYPHKLFLDYDHGYRARRIEDMIVQKGGGISIEDMKAMQGDDLNISASEIMSYLSELSFEDGEVIAVRDRLLGWDGRMDMDGAEAALYAYFWVALVEEIFGDQIPSRLWNRDRALAGGSRLLSCVYNLLQEPANRWWDDANTLDKTETRDDILARTFVKAYENGTGELGGELDEWRWGDIHTATFQNQTLGKSGIGLVEKIFNRGPVPTAGGFHQVNRSDFSIDEPFQVYHLSAMRQIIDLKDLSKSLMIHTTGQSGHPKHRHYDDFIDPWRFTEYHPTRWERDVVEKTYDNRLILKPI